MLEIPIFKESLVATNKHKKLHPPAVSSNNYQIKAQRPLCTLHIIWSLNRRNNKRSKSTCDDHALVIYLNLIRREQHLNHAVYILHLVQKPVCLLFILLRATTKYFNNPPIYMLYIIYSYMYYMNTKTRKLRNLKCTK